MFDDQEKKFIAYRKLSFILNEVFADMGIAKSNFASWLSNLLTAFLMLFIRMCMHYIGQYVFLKMMDCPVSDFEFLIYRMKITYGYRNVLQEIGVVCVGPLFNTLVFLFMIEVINKS